MAQVEPDLKLPVRKIRQKIADFMLFPARALLLIEQDKCKLTSLASERFYYVSEETVGYCLDVGCGKGIDVYKYEISR